jgi:hypothetical protein
VNAPNLPTVEMPAALARAARTRADRAADLAEATKALREARAGIQTAIIEDRGAYATARDAGKPDPGPTRERDTRELVANLERVEAGEALRLARAEDELKAAVSGHIDEWAARVAKRWGALDREAEKALAALEQVETKRLELRRVGVWIGEVQRTADLGSRVRNPSDATSVQARLRREHERRAALAG